MPHCFYGFTARLRLPDAAAWRGVAPEVLPGGVTCLFLVHTTGAIGRQPAKPAGILAMVRGSPLSRESHAMSRPARPPLPSLARLLLAALLLNLAACASLGGRDPLDLQVVGIEPLPGEGFELRMAMKLRLQNPNTTPLDFHGIALELRVNDRPLARGVSDQRGSVPAFGETLLVVPVSISALSALRQALGVAEQARLERVPYVLRGKLGGGLLGSRRFSDTGSLDLSGIANGRR